MVSSAPSYMLVMLDKPSDWHPWMWMIKIKALDAGFPTRNAGRWHFFQLGTVIIHSQFEDGGAHAVVGC